MSVTGIGSPVEAARKALAYAAATECDGCSVCDLARQIIAEHEARQRAEAAQ